MLKLVKNELTYNNVIYGISDASCKTVIKYALNGVACVVKINGETIIKSIAYKSDNGNPHEVELQGILLTLDIILKYIKRNNVKDKRIFIFCDNLSAINNFITSDFYEEVVTYLVGQRCNLNIAHGNEQQHADHKICHAESNRIREKLFQQRIREGKKNNE